MKKWGERRGSNPRIMESQSIALPLGDARHLYTYYTIKYLKRAIKNELPRIGFEPTHDNLEG